MAPVMPRISASVRPSCFPPASRVITTSPSRTTLRPTFAPGWRILRESAVRSTPLLPVVQVPVVLGVDEPGPRVPHERAVGLREALGEEGTDAVDAAPVVPVPLEELGDGRP